MDAVFIEAVKQAPTLGILAFIVLAFLKFLRGEGEVAREFIKSTMDGVSDALNKQSESNEKLDKSHDRLSKIVMLHDATVRGKNESTMGSHEEVMGRFEKELERKREAS